MKCAVTGQKYRIFGYHGKQVRDNIHSADLVEAFWQFYRAPKAGAVYNMGGSRHSHCSMMEAITLCEAISGNRLDREYVETNRTGDHIWYVSDVSRFKTDYPKWSYRYDLNRILQEIHDAIR
jgi:CDP-paratose 2-epimerase